VNLQRKSRRRLAIFFAFTSIVFANLALPAQADVTSVGGGAFGASLNSTLLGQVLPPTPSVTLPPTGGGPFTDAAVPISIPGLLTANVLEATTQGGLLGTHQGFAASSADLAEVTVGGIAGVTPAALTLQAVHSECLSNGDGSSGETDIIGLFAGAPLPTNPPPNFVPAGDLPAGIASIVINEQIVQNSTGGTSIVVNALHVQLLPTGVPGAALVDLIIGSSRCAAAGPDVNTGQVAVIKQAPADAQTTAFTFTITCPGLAGSPFTRTVTGSGTTDPVINVPTGTVCTASESTVAGFVEQPPQTFAPVASGATQTVTFINSRVAQTGSVAVVKVAPDDAQTTVFDFTITCPGVAGSPFTRSVTGSGTSTAVTGIPAGTVCTAAETAEAGFVVQPNQNFPAVTAGGTQTVTFFNQRTGVTTGAVAVIKQAPADAQTTAFNFTITCPGVAGSPFTRTVTGSGTSTPVGNLPVGTVCTAAETPVAGFNTLPNQTFPAVTAGGTATVTFVNTRTVAGTGSVAVVKQAPADAQSTVFTFTITCPGVTGSPFTRTVTGSATTAPVTGIPAGTVCTAAETPVAGFNNQANQNFPAVTAGGTQTVTFVNTRSTGLSITVNKSADPISRPAPGGTFTFTVQVVNNSGVPVVITGITDDVHGNLNGRGSCDVGETIAAGGTYTCSFSVEITGQAGDTETDKVTVTVVDAGGRTGTDTSDGVTISITEPGTDVRGPTIIINNTGTATANCTATSAEATYQIAQVNEINVNNKTSSECVATAAPVIKTTTTTPTHTTTPTGKVLARTGADTLALLAFAMALMVTGYIMLSSRLAANRRYDG
jgi:hypothetical protein